MSSYTAIRRRNGGGTTDEAGSSTRRAPAAAEQGYREDSGLLNAVSSWFSSIPSLTEILTEEVDHDSKSSKASSVNDESDEVLGAVTQHVDMYSQKVFRGVNMLGAKAAETLTALEGQLTNLVLKLTGDELPSSPAHPARPPLGNASRSQTAQPFATDFAYHLGGFYTSPGSRAESPTSPSPISNHSNDLALSPDTATRKHHSSSKQDPLISPELKMSPDSPASSERIGSAHTAAMQPAADKESAQLESSVAQLQEQYEKVLADLQSTMSRVSQLQQENQQLRAQAQQGHAEPDPMQDVIQAQLQSLMAERARLAEENARLSRENAGLQELLEYARTEPQRTPSPLESLVYLSTADGIDAQLEGTSPTGDPYQFVSRPPSCATTVTPSNSHTLSRTTPMAADGDEAVSGSAPGSTTAVQRSKSASLTPSNSAPNSSSTLFKRSSPFRVAPGIESQPVSTSASASRVDSGAIQLLSDGDSETDIAPPLFPSHSQQLRRVSSTMKPVLL